MNARKPCPVGFAEMFLDRRYVFTRSHHKARTDQMTWWVEASGGEALIAARELRVAEAKRAQDLEAAEVARLARERAEAERLGDSDLRRNRTRRTDSKSYVRGRQGPRIDAKERAVRAACQYLRQVKPIGRLTVPVRPLVFMGNWRWGTQVVSALELLQLAVDRGMTEDMIPSLLAGTE
jgi:hypothetical protein